MPSPGRVPSISSMKSYVSTVPPGGAPSETPADAGSSPKSTLPSTPAALPSTPSLLSDGNVRTKAMPSKSLAHLLRPAHFAAKAMTILRSSTGKRKLQSLKPKPHQCPYKSQHHKMALGQPLLVSLKALAPPRMETPRWHCAPGAALVPLWVSAPRAAPGPRAVNALKVALGPWGE